MVRVGGGWMELGEFFHYYDPAKGQMGPPDVAYCVWEYTQVDGIWMDDYEDAWSDRPAATDCLGDWWGDGWTGADACVRRRRTDANVVYTDEWIH